MSEYHDEMVARVNAEIREAQATARRTTALHAAMAIPRGQVTAQGVVADAEAFLAFLNGEPAPGRAQASQRVPQSAPQMNAN